MSVLAGPAVASIDVGRSSPSPGTPSYAPGTLRAGPRPYDPFTFLSLDQCRAETAGNAVQIPSTLRGFGVNHFQWCAWARIVAVLLDSAGKRIADLQYRLTVVARAAEDERIANVVFYVDKIRWRWLGPLNGGNTYLRLDPSCALDGRGGNCGFSPTHSPQTINHVFSNPVAVTLRSEQAVSGTNPYAIMEGLMRFNLVHTSTVAGTMPVGPSTAQDVRCDSVHAVKPEYRTPACIFTNARPVLNLNINDANIDESAGHIRFAQQNPQLAEPVPPPGVTKTIPSMLVRHWDDALNRDQRARSVAVCLERFGPPEPGKDCDEFPFASTYQGSLGTPGPGQGTTNYNFSVKRIDSNDNRRVGAWLQQWYYKDRILQGDAFRVNIFDGPIVTEEDSPPPPVAPADRRGGVMRSDR